MRIYLVKARSLLGFSIGMLLILIAAIAVFNSNINVLSVFAPERDLPIYSIDIQEKKAAITFDCAWGADDIPEILDVLKKENVKASFFIVGQWAEKYPDMVRMISRDGHDVGNHSYSHLRMGTLDRSRTSSEIRKCGSKLTELSGGKMELFRAPYGDYSNSLVAAARELGYYTIQWNVDSLDWKTGISKEDIVRRIYDRITPGSIILFHNDTPYTAKILPDVIKTLKDRGYTFLPVSEMIMRESYIIDFEGRQKKKN